MIPKEAIEAARKAILEHDYNPYTQDGLSAILTAAFAAMPGQAVKVKPLGKEFEEAIFSDVETLYEATTLTPAPDLASENERLRAALFDVVYIYGMNNAEPNELRTAMGNIIERIRSAALERT